MAEKVKECPRAAEELPAKGKVAELLPPGEVAEAQRPEPQAAEVPEPGGAPVQARFILCTATGRTHRPSDGWTPDAALPAWRARCGWAFARGNSRLPTGRPRPPFCKICFRGMEVPGGDSDDSD